MKCYHHIDTDAVGACSVCGRPICGECAGGRADRAICPECEATMEPPSTPLMPASGISGPTKRGKSPTAAFFLALIPGLGHFYVGEHLKALVFFVLFVYLVSQAQVAPSLPVLLSALYCFQIYDAVRSARKTRAPDEDAKPLPRRAEPPKESAFWAWFLIVTGVLFQLDLLGVITMAFLPKLIPVVLIVIGLKLITGRSRGHHHVPRHAADNKDSHETSD